MAGTSRRRALALGLGACLVVLAGVAVAYWRGGGSGAGAGASSSPDQVTLSPGTPSAQLYPGGTATVVVSMTNGASAAVRVGSLALATTEGDAGFDTDEDHADCPTDSLSFATQTNGGAGWTVPAGGSLAVTLPASLAMATSAADTCQGATYTVHLRVTG